MINKNRYYFRSRISEARFRQPARCFSLDFTATSTAALTGISVRSVNSIYLKIRQCMTKVCEVATPLKDAVEVDESCSGARRVRGKPERGAWGKTIISGLLKRQDKGYTGIGPDCSRATLQGMIKGHVAATVIHSDGWRSYDGPADMGFDKHFRIHHGENGFANGERHINAIESFWTTAKRRLPRFNGIPEHTFYLHLKETGYRFNHRRDNLYLEPLR
ncbi:MAG: IS1595 family transposase [Pseudomonadota bacterium]|nr:IS1595 family transposase [Pseudomonadota bacterium]